MRTSALIIVAAAVIVGAVYGAQWLGLFATLSPVQGTLEDSATSTPIQVEEFARGLDIPWSMVWTSPTRILVSERTGNIRIIENSVLREKPLHTFSDISTGGEEGLMSLAVHPQYATNKFLYASYAYGRGQEMFVRVVRFRDDGSRLSNQTTIVDAIPAAQYHAGSRIAFGPDSMLYITTGDATDRKLAQDVTSLAGKILRVHDDGAIPSDNPFPKNPIWSIGHRNPQGIAWHPESQQLYETEHGPSLFDGPAGGDEVNRIVRAGNYGWPLVSHEDKQEGTIAPLLLYTPAEAPGSGMFYSGTLFEQFKNNFFFGALKGEGLIRVVFDAKDPDKVWGFEKLFGGEYGRIRDVAQGPDGFIYFSTSNRDGRGDVREGDDKIYRIVPQK